VDRIDLYRIYVRVAECESFTRAAETLGLPRSSVSTAVQDLETRLGARLLHRTTRKVSLTHDGKAFYERCLRLLADVDETENLFRQTPTRVQGRLKVDVPGRIGRLIIAPALPSFLDMYPELQVDLGVTDRAVNLVEDNVDCAIRVGPLSDSGLISRGIGDLALVNCASPEYLAKYGTPKTIAELDRHLAVLYASPTTGRIEEWEWIEGATTHTRPVHGRVIVNGAEAYIACCLAGLGLIQIPAYDVRDHLASGALVEVLPDHRAAPMPMTLLYPHRRHLSRRLQAFIEWVVPLLQKRVL
jgi:DNA-binding transcriptional LysR family regulator